MPKGIEADERFQQLMKRAALQRPDIWVGGYIAVLPMSLQNLMASTCWLVSEGKGGSKGASGGAGFGRILWGLGGKK